MGTNGYVLHYTAPAARKSGFCSLVAERWHNSLSLSLLLLGTRFLRSLVAPMKNYTEHTNKNSSSIQFFFSLLNHAQLQMYRTSKKKITQTHTHKKKHRNECNLTTCSSLLSVFPLFHTRHVHTPYTIFLVVYLYKYILYHREFFQ